MHPVRRMVPTRTNGPALCDPSMWCRSAGAPRTAAGCRRLREDRGHHLRSKLRAKDDHSVDNCVAPNDAAKLPAVVGSGPRSARRRKSGARGCPRSGRKLSNHIADAHAEMPLRRCKRRGWDRERGQQELETLVQRLRTDPRHALHGLAARVHPSQVDISLRGGERQWNSKKHSNRIGERRGQTETGQTETERHGDN